MPLNRESTDVFDRDFLAIRHHLLNVAAGLDRVESADNPSAAKDHPRWQQIQSAIVALTQHSTGRAEQIQLIFSRPYDSQWNR
jgi:hypothetical protein